MTQLYIYVHICLETRYIPFVLTYYFFIFKKEINYFIHIFVFKRTIKNLFRYRHFIVIILLFYSTTTTLL